MYQPISPETAEAIWERMADMTEVEATRLMQQMEREQPVLQTYLLAVDEDFTEDEQQEIFFIGIVAWQMMKQSSRRMNKITEERIDKVDERNFTFFNSISETDPDMESMVEKMMEDYPEPQVLGFILSALMDEDPEDPGIRDEMKGLAFFHLKTALDAMIASLK